MRYTGRFAALVLAASILACRGNGGDKQAAGSAAPPLPPDLGNMTPTVTLETSQGKITLELDRARAPESVDNFLTLVRGGFYDGLIFHRVIPGFMVQAGGFLPDMSQRRTRRPPVPNEADNGLQNVRGAVAMARTSDPQSATTQFFIDLVDNPRLDFTSKTPQGWGYAVFGRVADGMDVVDSIAAVATTTRGPYQNVPVDPVVIERAYVVGEERSG